MVKRKYRYRAFLSKDSPQRVFSNFGLTFWRGEFTDLPKKMTPQQMKWIESHDHLKLSKVLISEVVSDESGVDVQLDLIPVMTPIALERELKARKEWSSKLSSDEMRNILTRLVKEECGLIPKAKKEVKKPKETKESKPKKSTAKVITKERVNKMTYAQLQKTATSMGLSAKGKKATLKARILKGIKT